jgi:hypothetical protein
MTVLLASGEAIAWPNEEAQRNHSTLKRSDSVVVLLAGTRYSPSLQVFLDGGTPVGRSYRNSKSQACASRRVGVVWISAEEKEIECLLDWFVRMRRRHDTTPVCAGRIVAYDFLVHQIMDALAIRSPSA